MDKHATDPDDDLLDELERQALLTAVAESRACTEPDIAHEEFERQARQSRADLLMKAAALLA